MSTIDQLPYDINRASIERNATVRKKTIAPVSGSDAIKPVKAHQENRDRRAGDDRRKDKRDIVTNKRYLRVRRSLAKPLQKSQQKLANAHKSGHIIDLEV